uniref:Venom toxin n=1 Tax=Hemiscorpius lepturus TaxID=520031 RepID=A0A1L4BJ74_HEMLE|nr:venom toxin [Hemiscorpius lepturus]
MRRGRLATMMLRLLFIAHFLITVSSKGFDKTAPYIIRPDFNKDGCKIQEEADCSKHLDSLQQHIINLLNAQRYSISSGLGEFKKVSFATNMLYLEGDPELINKAQTFVETCFQQPTLQGCVAPGETEQDGDLVIYEQIYPIDTLFFAEERIEALMKSDISKFPSRFVESYDPTLTDDKIQNFAKIAHARVWKVGCGFADFIIADFVDSKARARFKEVVVCFFGPPKLRKGEKLYMTGSGPCADCPRGTSCLTEGKFSGGLCRRQARKEHEQTIWKCDLKRYSDGCSVERKCAHHWTVNKTGGFKYVVVSGSCVTVSLFIKAIHVEQPSCFRFRYMKSGDLLLQTKVIAFVSVVDSHHGHSTDVGKRTDASEWTDVTLDISPHGNGKAIQVGVVVRSYPTSDGKQLIKVRDFEVVAGRCLQQPA